MKEIQIKTKSFLIFFFVVSLMFVGFLFKLPFDFKSSSQKEVVPTITIAPFPVLNPSHEPTMSPKVTPTKQPLPVLNGASIFNAVNAYRSQNGEPFLSVSDELCRIAESRADYMMINNMSAFKTSGLGSHTGFRDVQYSGNGVGEDLAANVVSTANVMAVWKNSPPHNELMLTTIRDGTPITKGCVATRVSEVGSIVVLEVGDK